MGTDCNIDAARVARNRYYREYRQRNRERIQAINRRYWMKRAEKEREEQSADEQK